MKDGFLEGPGIAYRSTVFDTSKKTLVFIHGLSGTCAAWEAFEKALEPHFNVVTYDLRGHGLSKRYKTYDDYELGHFSDDLNALLEHLRIPTCTLIAHSMGSTVAVSFLHQHQTKVESVVFLAPNYKQHVMAGSVTRAVIERLVEAYKLLPFYPKPGHRLQYANFGYSPDLSLKRIVPEIRDLTLRVYLYCLNRLYEFAHDDWWRVEVPTTIVHGTSDFFVPYRLSVELAEKIPAATLVTLEKANHMLVLNNAKEIIKLIEKLYRQ